MLTEKQFLKKYKGKYVHVYTQFDYQEGEWFYEVRGVSRVIRENYDLAENQLVRII